LSSFALDLLSLERRLPPTSAHVPYTTLFRSESEPRRRRHELWRIRSGRAASFHCRGIRGAARGRRAGHGVRRDLEHAARGRNGRDRKSTRLNSSHVKSSYAVFCLKTKTAPKG